MVKKNTRHLTEKGRDRLSGLYHSHMKYVLKHIYKAYWLEPQEVEEVVNEVYLAVGEAIAKGELPYKPKKLFAWLKTATKRVTWRYVEKRNSQGITNRGKEETLTYYAEEKNENHSSDDEIWSPEKICLVKEQYKVVEKAIESLPHRERVVLEADFHGRSRKEVAQKAGISVGQTGTYAKRGKARILADFSGKISVEARAA